MLLLTFAVAVKMVEGFHDCVQPAPGHRLPPGIRAGIDRPKFENLDYSRP